MKKFLFLAILTGCAFTVSFSQTVTDALRYSTMEFGSTGRSIGAGNSFSALGADGSLISANPAGLASFRRSEFTVTPGLFIKTTTSQLLGAENSYEDSKTNFNVGNIQLVLSGRPSSSHWRAANFSIGFNRIANYNQRFNYEGATAGTITDRWLEVAQGLSRMEMDDFEGGLAYDANVLIETGTDEYITDFTGYDDVLVPKAQDVTTEGSMNELSFSFAGNYEDRIYGGISIAVPFFSYDEEKIYSETDEQDQIPYFNNLEYIERLTTTGAGINLKLGLIYRINQMFRLGVAAHTPTLLGLEDNFSTEISYDYTVDGENTATNERSPDGIFEYRLVTPWRVMGSAGMIIGKHGFISSEIEWVDYGNSSFNFDSGNAADLDYERDLNQNIETTYQSTVNWKIGGEWAINIFRVRAGVILNGSPYVGESEFSKIYSLGLGIRERGFFLDLAYRRSEMSEGFYPYQTNNAGFQFVSNDVNSSLIVLTLGFKI